MITPLFTLALGVATSAYAEVPPPTVTPEATRPAPLESSDGAIALERVRTRTGRGGAVASFLVSGGAFGGLIATQVSRIGHIRRCARALEAGPYDLFEGLAVTLGCTVALLPPGRTAAAASLGPFAIAMAGVGGLALGRGDVRLGATISRSRINRRIKIGAALLGSFAGILVTVPPALFRMSFVYPYETPGFRLQQAQYIVTDISVAGAAIGAGILARAHQYKRHTPTLAVTPMLSPDGTGVSIAGRF